jgi:hypothetical protein
MNAKFPQINRTAGVALVALGLCASAPQQAAAVTPSLIDDFEDGTTKGWSGSVTSNVADAGPAGAGDNALLVSSSNRIVTINSAQWAGDYIAAGITQLAMDVRYGGSVDLPGLQLRIGIANGSFGPGGDGDTYVSASPIAVAGDGAWHHIVFDVSPAAFSPHGTNTNPNPDAAAALASVTHLRILHNPNPDFKGANGAADFYLDNIQAVPEPSAGALAAIAATAWAARRRRC